MMYHWKAMTMIYIMVSSPNTYIFQGGCMCTLKKDTIFQKDFSQKLQRPTQKYMLPTHSLVNFHLEKLNFKYM